MSFFKGSRNRKNSGERAEFDVTDLNRSQREELWVYRVLKFRARGHADPWRNHYLRVAGGRN